MIGRHVLPLACLLAVSATLPAPAEEAPRTGPEYEMTTYQLVFVVTNPDFAEDEWIGDQLADHRASRFKTANDHYLHNLVKSKVALIAGALPESERIHQVAVIEAESPDDAAFYFRHSPGIERGRTRLEIYPWWAAKGILKLPRDPFDLRDAYLGLLKRPADAPDLSEERLAEIQAGHLENLEKMTAAGDLVIAGPVEQGGHLRGILIFRTRDPDYLRELIDEDPAIRAGRLEVELHRWRVPKGNWIRRAYQTGETPIP